MNLHLVPPENKMTKTTAKTSSSLLLPCLPDEIAENCLAWIPRSYYPKLSVVSKSFRSLLSSMEIYSVRSHLGSTEQCLYVCLWDQIRCKYQWYTLKINPNRKLLLPVPFNYASAANPIAIGSEIYVIGGPVGDPVGSLPDMGPSSAVRVLDCRNHTWRDAPSMNVARYKAAACAYDGKIYVVGGLLKEDDEESSYGEVFDIKTQTWKGLPDPEVGKCCFPIITEREGKIYLMTNQKTYAYNTQQGKWECVDEWFPASHCVMENVSYYFGFIKGRSFCKWFDIKDVNWKDVKGLDTLNEKYKRNGHPAYTFPKLVRFSGKLLALWEEHMIDSRQKIWCAEIVLEKRDGGEI